MDQERNERLEALDEIFGDDPFEKQRQKEAEKRQKKVDKLQAKMDKKREKLAKKLEDGEELDEELLEELSEEEVQEEESQEEENAYDVEDEDYDEYYDEEEEESSKKKRKKKKDRKKEQAPEDINVVKDLINLLVYILVLVVICWFVLTYVGQRTVVSGDSMNNTLTSGDSLWIDKISYCFSDPERFDIVVFPYGDVDEDGEETYYIKRIIGLPGETVYIDSDGNIYIDGELLEEDYGKETIAEGHLGIFATSNEPITLGEDEYFVLGDNRNNSRDSRLSDVGNINREDLIGKAVFRFSGEFGFIE